MNCPVARLSCGEFFGGKLTLNFPGGEMSSDELTGGELSGGELTGGELTGGEFSAGELSSSRPAQA